MLKQLVYLLLRFLINYSNTFALSLAVLSYALFFSPIQSPIRRQVSYGFCSILICQTARLTRVNIYIVRVIYDANTKLYIYYIYIFGANKQQQHVKYCTLLLKYLFYNYMVLSSLDDQGNKTIVVQMIYIVRGGFMIKDEERILF